MGKNLHELVGQLRNEINGLGFDARYYFSVKSDNEFYGIIFVGEKKDEREFISFLLSKIDLTGYGGCLNADYETQGPMQANALVIHPEKHLTKGELEILLVRLVNEFLHESKNWKMQNR